MVHDGFKNTYSFSKDGKFVILVPMKLQLILKKNKDVDQIFLSEARVEYAIKGGEVVLYLVVKD